jgi:hypothetical protein
MLGTERTERTDSILITTSDDDLINRGNGAATTEKVDLFLHPFPALPPVAPHLAEVQLDGKASLVRRLYFEETRTNCREGEGVELLEIKVMLSWR